MVVLYSIIEVLKKLKKPNGVELDLGVFTTDRFKEISAVIFFQLQQPLVKH